MHTIWVALLSGVLMGVLYGLLGVRSPAPPLIALIGLLGILIGEQMVPIAERVRHGQPVTWAWWMDQQFPVLTGVGKPLAKDGAS